MARQMKLSGVESMGDIPVTWSVVRVKDLCNENCEQLTTLPDEIRYVDIGSVSVNGIKSIQHLKKVDIPSRARRLPQKGDIIVSNVRTYLRAITRVMEEGLVVSTGFSVFTPLTNTFPEFMFYTLQSDSFMDQVDASSKGISYPAISGSALRNLKIVQPSLNEQVAIASFLDDRTTAIDSKIQLLEEKATALADLRKSVIHQAVTKGLDSNVGMKSSGVEWIGDVPTHWSILRGKQFMTYKKELNRDKKHTRIWSLTMDGVRENDPDNPIGMVPSDYGTYQLFNKGDFVFKLIDLENYKTSRFGIVPDEGIMSSAYMRMQVQSGISAYLKWVFLDMWRLGVFNAQGSNGVRSNLTYSDMYDMVYAFPPDTEQKIVAAYLDSKIATIEESINTIIAQLEALKSLRQSIIHEAVTGKIDVADHGYHYA